MAQPIPYERSYSFTDYQTVNPADPLPGIQVDSELNSVQQTLDQILANLELIQRDDGALANESVGIDQLAAEISFGFNTVEDWTAGHEYVTNDGVWYSNTLYRCLEDHTASVFATDLAAGRWSELVSFATVLASASTSATNAAASETAAAASAVTASNAATAAAASYDSFDDRYLGAKAADPALDNDGNALIAGAIYFNTSTAKMRVYGASWADVTGAVTRTTFEYVATNLQTTFSGVDANGNTLSYTAGAIQVFVNGLRQHPDDYTATNGTSVVFGSGLATSDEVIIEEYMSFAIGSLSAGSVDANALASDAVTTIKILDSNVTTAKIADDNVTYAKIQNVSATSRILGRKTSGAGDVEECTLSEILDFVGSAAQGDLLYRGAATWARLGAGTSGQVLTTGGAGANPSWSSSGTRVLLQTQNASASASIAFSSTYLTSTYKAYEIEMIDVISASDGVSMQLVVSEDNGSNYKTTNEYNYANLNVGSGSATAGAAVGAAAANILLQTNNTGNAAGEGLAGKIRVYNPLGTTLYKKFLYDTVSMTSGEISTHTRGCGEYLAVAAINNIKLQFSSGNITSGIFKLYGVI